MTTQTSIKQKAQQLARLERSLAMSKIKQRKADTRRKIQFGGLVIKANMADYNKAIILGALLDAAQQIHDDPKLLDIFQHKGEAAFMGYGDKTNG